VVFLSFCLGTYPESKSLLSSPSNLFFYGYLAGGTSFLKSSSSSNNPPGNCLLLPSSLSFKASPPNKPLPSIRVYFLPIFYGSILAPSAKSP